MENLVVPTVPQKPDIVLQLTKNDLQNNMKMTYLFDAKYRIEGRVNGVDTPPDDAINQMHRYRDAIYYKEHSSAELKKEIVGGYILFPGDGNKVDIEVSKFYKTIDEVNIGAFPLRPKDKDNRDLLVKFIESLIGKASSEILVDSIPQKGLSYNIRPKEGDSLVLVGYAKSKDKENILKRAIYYTRADFEPGSLRLRPGFEWSRYLLLHDAHNSERKLYKLNEKGPRFVTKQSLIERGFNPSHGEYFLVFDIVDPYNPQIIEPEVVLPNVKAKFDPYFISYSELMQEET